MPASIETFAVDLAKNPAVAEMARSLRADGRAAVVGGAHLYGLQTDSSDVDVWVFHVLPARAFLGLKEPPLVHSERRTSGGQTFDLRSIDLKAIVASWSEGSYYELEHLFSPLVLYGEEWLAAVRAESTRCASRRAYYGVLRRASTELRFAHPDARSRARAYLHALRSLMAGIHYLATAEVISPIRRLDKLLLRADYLEDALRYLNSSKERPDAEPAWLKPLRADVDRLTAKLDEAYRESRLREGHGLEAELDHYLKKVRLEEK